METIILRTRFKRKVSMKKILFSVMAAALLSGCTAGTCYQAMKLRRAAESAQGLEKAALLGKADAIQKECDAQNKALQEAQKTNARGKTYR
jgi:hypothetical protein